MRLAIITDSYAPLRSSAAVQLVDLANEFVAQGHDPLIICPTHEISDLYCCWEHENVHVLSIKAPNRRDLGYVRRTLAELCMPYCAMRALMKSPYKNVIFDGVIWYSPSIFHGPLVKAIKQKSHCRSYLVLRDIFPEWAVDMGLLGKGLPYLFFKFIEKFQYSMANVIGVQTYANQSYLKDWSHKPNRRVEVLQNWLAETSNTGCSIKVQNTILAGRKIFVYAGNMGVAQGIDLILHIAKILDSQRHDIGFLLVGRGSELKSLKKYAISECLTNVVFYNEINPAEVSGLYDQCDVGIVALDSRHRTHNIPGKFLSYIQNGLPVFACVNEGNDLLELISTNRIGLASTRLDPVKLAVLVQGMIDAPDHPADIETRCKTLAKELFSPEVAVRQIIRALQS